MVDNLFLLAIFAFGWGLSLATYRLFARRSGWPMGALQADLPAVPVLLGALAFLAGLAFAAARGETMGGWVIVVCGLLLAVFWTGFLRVGAQIALFLAPAAAFLLLLGWLAEPLGYARRPWASESIGQTLSRKGDQLEGKLREYLREDDKSSAPAQPPPPAQR
jgi:hypothetical protein